MSRRHQCTPSVDPERSRTFRGEVAIDLALDRPRSRIRLHAADLRVTKPRIEVDGRVLRGKIARDESVEMVEVRCDDETGYTVVYEDEKGRVLPLAGVRVVDVDPETGQEGIDSITASDGSFYLGEVRPVNRSRHEARNASGMAGSSTSQIAPDGSAAMPSILM